MSDPIDIVERLHYLRHNSGPATSSVCAGALAEITRLRAALAALEDTLTAVMPADFKDWHQNSRSEWPAVAAGVITALRADRDEGWRLAAPGASPPPAALAVPDGWALETGGGGFGEKGSRWVCVRNVKSQCGQDFYESRDPLIFGFLSALAASPQPPQPQGREGRG